MFKSFLLSIAKMILEYYLGKADDRVRAIFKEKQEKAKDEKHVKEAVDEVRRPLDPTKSIAEREKDEEDKFDRFRDKLNP